MNTQRDRSFDSHATPTHAAFPFHLNWDADQLAAAVPLRLHQLFAIGHVGATEHETSANQAPQVRRPRPSSYLPGSALPVLFRVR